MGRRIWWERGGPRNFRPRLVAFPLTHLQNNTCEATPDRVANFFWGFSLCPAGFSVAIKWQKWGKWLEVEWRMRTYCGLLSQLNTIFELMHKMQALPALLSSTISSTTSGFVFSFFLPAGHPFLLVFVTFSVFQAKLKFNVWNFIFFFFFWNAVSGWSCFAEQVS